MIRFTFQFNVKVGDPHFSYSKKPPKSVERDIAKIKDFINWVTYPMDNATGTHSSFYRTADSDDDGFAEMHKVVQQFEQVQIQGFAPSDEVAVNCSLVTESSLSLFFQDRFEEYTPQVHKISTSDPQ